MLLAFILCSPGALEELWRGLRAASRLTRGLEAVQGSQRNTITVTLLSCISISSARSILFTLRSVLCQPLSRRLRKTGRRQHVTSAPAERASQWQLCQLVHSSSPPPTTKAAFDNLSNIYLKESSFAGENLHSSQICETQNLTKSHKASCIILRRN